MICPICKQPQIELKHSVNADVDIDLNRKKTHIEQNIPLH